MLDSPDVGTARLALRSRQRELATARIEETWKDEVAQNVARLIPELRTGVPATQIEKQYADRPLGSNRALLLQAYAEFEIAAHDAEKTTGLHRDKIVGEHPLNIALHTLEGARAKFEAALEQVRFDANQQKLVADQQVKSAEAAVIDAAQRLRIMGVEENVIALLAHPGTPPTAGSSSHADIDDASADITNYTIVAPFDGTIIAKFGNAVPSQKADMNDVLFTLADLTSVWVVANVYESDFAFLQALKLGGTVHLTATAYPARTFEAKIISIGAMVDATTRTVPIVAEMANLDGLFKLGMFARIAIDRAETEQLLTVPTSSIVEIEGRKGVFLPRGSNKEGYVFSFHPVKLGREALRPPGRCFRTRQGRAGRHQRSVHPQERADSSERARGRLSFISRPRT